jgi:hypothetical protein
MQDRPTAVELLRAAREFCERDLLPELTGRRRFHTRVLANVLGILEREWEGEEDALRAEWQRLDTLLAPRMERSDSLREAERSDSLRADSPETAHALGDAVRERNKELSARIRSGGMDDRWEELLTALRETTAEKLAIANPGYSAPSSAGA